MTIQIYNEDDVKHLKLEPEQAKKRERFLALFIGILAIGLAFGVQIIDAQYDAFCARDSISHYFYEPRAGTFFVMALTVVAAFLYSYRGEKPLDNYVAGGGAIAALLIAFFPTDGVGCDPAESGSGFIDLRPAIVVSVPSDPAPDGQEQFFDLTPRPDDAAPAEGTVRAEFANERSQTIHGRAAVALFIVFLYFSIYAFTRTNAPVDLIPGTDKWTVMKRVRNLAYWACSAVMLGAGLIFLGWFPYDIPRPIFWAEAIFLAAFGVSWLIKSRLILGPQVLDWIARRLGWA